MLKRTISKSDVKVSKWVFIIFGISIIVLPILINWSLFLDLPPTPTDLGNPEWLSFWGSFIGGSIGGIATLIAISYTLVQNSKYHIELMKTQEVNNEMILDNQNEMKRVDVMPYLNFSGKYKEGFKTSLFAGEQITNPRYEIGLQFPETYIILDDKISSNTKLQNPYKTILNKNGITIKDGSLFDTGIIEQGVELCNIGLGAAVNVIVDLLDKDYRSVKEMILPPINIMRNKPIEWRFVFGENFKFGTYYLKFSIMDIQCNHFYEQKIRIINSRNSFGYENITKPIMVNDYSDRLNS